jgi:hypothetical protein
MINYSLAKRKGMDEYWVRFDPDYYYINICNEHNLATFLKFIYDLKEYMVHDYTNIDRKYTRHVEYR